LASLSVSQGHVLDAVEQDKRELSHVMNTPINLVHS